MKPQYVPKTKDQKIGYLIEECGEVQAALGKTVRWGMMSFNPELDVREREFNYEWISRELQDLKRAIYIVEKHLHKKYGGKCSEPREV